MKDIRISLNQEWVETEDEKNGWIGLGWNEPPGFEIEEIIETDKYSNPIEAIFLYTGNIPFDHNFAANQIYFRLCHEAMRVVENNKNELIKDVRNLPEFKKYSNAMNVLEEIYEIKKP